MHKGSVVVKKTALLSLIADMKIMFKSNVSKDSKHIVWGQQMAYERILDEDVLRWSRNDYMHEVWNMSWTASCKPGETFEWLFSVDETYLEYVETRELYKLLNSGLMFY